MYSTPYEYYRRRTMRAGMRRKHFLVIGVLITVLLFGVLYNFAGNINGKNYNYYNSLSIMCSAMPLLGYSQSDSYPTGQMTSLILNELSGVFRLDRQSPVALLEQEMPLLALGDTSVVSASALDNLPPVPVVEESGQKLIAPELSEEALVAIYNTHTGETYALTDGVDRLDGKKGGVVQVAAALQEVLEQNYGIRVVRSEDIHDHMYNDSYARSRETFERMLELNPKIVAAFDIHRDSSKPRENSFVEIEGKKVAPILIIVGSDTRASFPEWRKNYSLAQRIEAEINKKYPGLCIGVRVKDGRYNQFLHPGSLLLEVGNVNNTTEEAVCAAKLLGEVLGPVVWDLVDSVEE